MLFWFSSKHWAAS